MRYIRRFVFSLIILALMATTYITSVPAPKAEAAPNGCGPEALYLYTLIPDTIYYWSFWTGTVRFSFKAACDRHDVCYSGSGISRSTCDTRFLNDMLAVCDRGPSWDSRTWCRSMAYTYYGAVRTFGGIAYTP